MSFPRNHIHTETDLIRGCIGGDRRYQEALYIQYSPKMYAVCLRYCGNSNDAQDVLQDGFVKVFRNLERFRAEGSFEGWMRRIFVNTAIEFFRKKISISTIPENAENTFEDKDWTAFDRLGEKDILTVVRNLSPGYRTIFNMYVIEGYSHKEISEALNISEGTSKSQLARARVILQKEIDAIK